MKVLHSRSWASFGVRGGCHPNLPSLECYRPAKMFPHCPHAASHGMDTDVRPWLDLLRGRPAPVMLRGSVENARGDPPAQKADGQSQTGVQ